jgi:hypothetical protein
MNDLIENKGVNALRLCDLEAFCLPGHKWPGNGVWWVEKSAVLCSESEIWRSMIQPSIAQRSVAQFSETQPSIAQRSVAQFSEAQFSIAQCFSAGIKNVPEPISAEGVYALAISKRNNRKGRKRPPAIWSVVFSSPGVNSWATEMDGVNTWANQNFDSIVTWCSESLDHILQLFLAKHSESLDHAAQPSLTQRFRAGLKNAHEPILAEGVYALSIPKRYNRKGRKRPPVQPSVIIPNPGVNSWATETDGVNTPATKTNRDKPGYWR